MIFSDLNWELDSHEDFADEKVKDGPPEDERDKLKAKETRKKAIGDMDPKTRESFENIKFYKFYPVRTPDTPDATAKSRYINKYYGNAHYLM
ncbi:hypothetical protein PR202_ga12633 [Eleusine coracana subsp. coracana]|uniref:Uncharacterized protein n=1 Tax=Eleusine coracana subsp. coracana TaxID=191504 RepID=A0AAV5CC51_ELECO|nr:hypothetical protein PR202_ga12633 [Eleusine coracana subsp. coracana]